jgi:peptidoglycan/LPS O-acetylase OafA/YrhL
LNNKISSIELIRFLAALSVVVYHYHYVFNDFNELTIQELPFFSFLSVFYKYGTYAVHIFFTISGFIFSYVYLSQKNIKAKEFFVNRFARLYPLHFITLLAVMFLSLANTEFSDYFINAFIPIYTDLYHFILQLFFVSYWGLQKSFSFNTPSWSISIEILMYIIFFLSAKSLNKYKITLPTLIILFFLTSYKFTNMFSFDEYALLFFSGILIYQISKFKKKNLLISASFLILIFSIIGNFKVLLFCPSFLILLIHLDKLLKNKKISELFNFSGGLSYSIYMLHFPLMVLFLLFEYLAVIDEKFYLSSYFFIFFILLLIFISIISFKFFEYPLNKIIRKFFL